MYKRVITKQPPIFVFVIVYTPNNKSAYDGNGQYSLDVSVSASSQRALNSAILGRILSRIMADSSIIPFAPESATISSLSSSVFV